LNAKVFIDLNFLERALASRVSEAGSGAVAVDAGPLLPFIEARAAQTLGSLAGPHAGVTPSARPVVVNAAYAYATGAVAAACTAPGSRESATGGGGGGGGQANPLSMLLRADAPSEGPGAASVLSIGRAMLEELIPVRTFASAAPSSEDKRVPLSMLSAGAVALSSDLLFSAALRADESVRAAATGHLLNSAAARRAGPQSVAAAAGAASVQTDVLVAMVGSPLYAIPMARALQLANHQMLTLQGVQQMLAPGQGPQGQGQGQQSLYAGAAASPLPPLHVFVATTSRLWNTHFVPSLPRNLAGMLQPLLLDDLLPSFVLPADRFRKEAPRPEALARRIHAALTEARTANVIPSGRTYTPDHLNALANYLPVGPSEARRTLQLARAAGDVSAFSISLDDAAHVLASRGVFKDLRRLDMGFVRFLDTHGRCALLRRTLQQPQGQGAKPGAPAEAPTDLLVFEKYLVEPAAPAPAPAVAATAAPPAEVATASASAGSPDKKAKQPQQQQSQKGNQREDRAKDVRSTTQQQQLQQQAPAKQKNVDAGSSAKDRQKPAPGASDTKEVPALNPVAAYATTDAPVTAAAPAPVRPARSERSRAATSGKPSKEADAPKEASREEEQKPVAAAAAPKEDVEEPVAETPLMTVVVDVTPASDDDEEATRASTVLANAHGETTVVPAEAPTTAGGKKKRSTKSTAAAAPVVEAVSAKVVNEPAPPATPAPAAAAAAPGVSAADTESASKVAGLVTLAFSKGFLPSERVTSLNLVNLWDAAKLTRPTRLTKLKKDELAQLVLAHHDEILNKIQ
jgi:hypothetical protein